MGLVTVSRFFTSFLFSFPLSLILTNSVRSGLAVGPLLPPKETLFFLRRVSSSLSSGVRPGATAGGLTETGQRQHVPWPLRHLYQKYTQAPDSRAAGEPSAAKSRLQTLYLRHIRVGHRALVLPYRHYYYY
ncbi:hypothetical protein HDV57DRAFT_46858 [Trichoderma longibrachiatum]